MPALDNIRHEWFCGFLLQGKSASEAYAAAGYRPNRGNAIRLKAHECIRKRLEELKAGKAALKADAERAEREKEQITAAMVIEGLLKEARREDEGSSHSARITAWGLLAKHLGMLIDRKIIGIKRLDEMGDEELRQIAGQVIEELDAQVSVDGNVGPVVAELLPPGEDPRDGDNATRIAIRDENEGIDANDINELDCTGN